MKRTTVICLMVVLLGIGCGYAGVEFGESRPYPQSPIVFDEGAYEAALMDAALLNTEAWVLKNLALDLSDTTRIHLSGEVKVDDQEE